MFVHFLPAQYRSNVPQLPYESPTQVSVSPSRSCLCTPLFPAQHSPKRKKKKKLTRKEQNWVRTENRLDRGEMGRSSTLWGRRLSVREFFIISSEAPPDTILCCRATQTLSLTKRPLPASLTSSLVNQQWPRQDLLTTGSWIFLRNFQLYEGFVFSVP